MPADSEGFIRGVKKVGDMSGTELGFVSDPLSPSSEHVYRNTSAKPPKRSSSYSNGVF